MHAIILDNRISTKFHVDNNYNNTDNDNDNDEKVQKS